MRSRPFIHHIALWLILFAVISLSACHSSSSGDHRQVFRLNLSVGLESIDPAYATELYSKWVDHMVYNTLVETDSMLHLQPSLATHWTVSPDGLTYTFYLRNDVFFQDNPLFPAGKGRRMTAADVVYSFSRIIDPKTASTGAWIFNERVAAKDPFIALNDTTMQIRLRTPFQPLPQILSMPYCSIVPQEVADHWGKDYRSHPCGTGPFQLKYWDEGNVLVLHRNPHYWEHDASGKSLPYLDAVQISFYETKAVEFLLFLQGKLDFINNIDGSFKDLVLRKDGSLKPEYANKIRLTKRVYLNTEYLGFLTDTTNPLMANSPTRNVLVRQAINYAIDRRKIVTYFKNGGGIPATGGFIPPGMAGFETVYNYGYHYDPQKALALLAQAGYPNGRGLPPITVQTPDNYADIVNFVATELQDVGIKLNVDNIQPAILKQQMAKSQSLMFRAQWIADYPDAETYLAFFNGHFPAPPNYTRFNNPIFNQWYNQSLTAPDTLRWRIYRAMDSLAISQAPVVPLYYELLLHFTRPNVTGFSANPMNVIELKKVRLQ
ncbi:MAG: ABC transporter substrate-binding protein [Flavipsychrobacter sp.]